MWKKNLKQPRYKPKSDFSKARLHSALQQSAIKPKLKTLVFHMYGVYNQQKFGNHLIKRRFQGTQNTSYKNKIKQFSKPSRKPFEILVER